MLEKGSTHVTTRTRKGLPKPLTTTTTRRRICHTRIHILCTHNISRRVAPKPSVSFVVFLKVRRRVKRRRRPFGSALAEGWEEYHGGGDWKMVAGPERALVRCDGFPFRARVQSAADVLAMQKCGVVNVQNNFALLDAYFWARNRREAESRARGPDVTGDFRAKRFTSSEINVVDVSFVSSGLSSNDALPIFNANLRLRVFRLFRHAV